MSARDLAAVLAARVPEKTVQAHGVALIRSLGGTAYVLGTRRRRGDHPGTMQTPGIPDVFFFLPSAPLRVGFGVAGWWEVKAEGGRLSAEQVTFRDLCVRANMPHVFGDLDALIAFLVDGGWIRSANVPHYRRTVRAEVSS